MSLTSGRWHPDILIRSSRKMCLPARAGISDTKARALESLRGLTLVAHIDTQQILVETSLRVFFNPLKRSRIGETRIS